MVDQYLTSVCVAWETRRAFDRIPLTSVSQLGRDDRKRRGKMGQDEERVLEGRRKRQKRCEWLRKEERKRKAG